MYINREVDIPEPLITAQREGKLVIFAGAGISMGAPSNLPSFVSLADQIASGHIHREDEERLDAFLGRLEERGVDVQQRARDILTPPGSAPSQLHYGLLNLLGTTNHYRVVTTNFDTHLTTALLELHPEPKAEDIFYAPALPLGREFRGIVYLHGSVVRRERLVLSDADFGRAYLTEGWATRFLMKMFESYTVLFVGYSHQDPIMEYLARGFIKKTPRYALDLPDPKNDRRWKHFGITPVHFPERSQPDKFSSLTDAITAWNHQANMGILDHENRIRQIVKSLPPLEPEVLDYLDSIVKDTATLRFFVKHAKLVEWLTWMEEKGALDKLFKTDEIIDEQLDLLSNWIASNFALQHSNMVLDLIRRRGLKLHPVFWDALTIEFATQKPRPNPDVLGRWAMILVNTSNPGRDDFSLSLLLSECEKPEEKHLALLLFSYLVEPIPRLEQSWWTHGEKENLPRLELKMRGKQYLLEKAWSNYFLPQIAEVHKGLRPLLTSLLIKAETTVAAWNELNLGYRRQAIENHEQDRHKNEWDFLIDAARDLLEWLLKNEVRIAEAMIDEWSNAQSVLLNRLAIHGLTESQLLDPDKVLKLIEDRGWLFNRRYKHEVYRLIERAFPNASSSIQRSFIRYSMETSVFADTKDENESHKRRDISDYERYNLAVWLRQAAPNSSIAIEHFEHLQQEFPNFGPRDHPDFNRWTGDFERTVPKSPVSVEELKNGRPLEYLDLLLTFQPSTSWDNPDRDGLLINVQKVVAESFEWARELMSLLADRKEWLSDLWKSIFDGFKDATDLEENQRNNILDFILQFPDLDHESGMEILSLIEHWLDSGEEKSVSNQLELVEQLTDRIFTSSTEEMIEEPDENWDWLSIARNSIGGTVAHIWLMTLSKHRANLNESWSGLPKDYQNRFEKIIYGDEPRAQYARIVLSSQFQFLFYLDADWSKQQLLWVFNWEHDEMIAEQSWTGFLFLGHWNEALFDVMLPYTRQLFSHLDSQTSERRNHLCDMLGGVAAYSSLNPWPEGWLSDFIRDADSATRERWAALFGRHLFQLTVEGTDELWNRWIDDYWSDRITGVPTPLSEKEKEEMLLWSVPLLNQMDAVVEKIVATSPPTDFNHDSFRRLEQGEIARKQPRATGLLLRHILSELMTIPYRGCEASFNMARDALKAGGEKDDLLDIAESLARLGCSNAQELRKLIGGD